MATEQKHESVENWHLKSEQDINSLGETRYMFYLFIY